MNKPKNGYFYSDDVELIKRIADELSYSGRHFSTIPGGIVQYALPKKKPRKMVKVQTEPRTKEQSSKRERWMKSV